MSSIFDYATFGLMLFFFNCRQFAYAGTAGPMKSYYETLFHTGWFVESLITQTLIVHVIRTNRIPFLQSRPSAGLSATTLAVIALAVWLPYSPLARTFGFMPLPGAYWLWLAAFLIAYMSLTHLVKTWFVRRFGD